MSSRTRLNNHFLYNLFCVANFFFHHKITNKNLISQKLKKLSEMLKVSVDDIRYSFVYLQQTNILYEINNYPFINFSLLKKEIKEENKRELRSFLILQANYEMLVKPEISAKAFWFLVQIAELKQKDIVYRFVMTENSIHNALVNKVSLMDIKKFLQFGTGRDKLTENVEYFLEEIDKRTGEIRISQGAGFLVTKSHILRNLVHDARLKKSLIKTISPTVSLINDRTDILDLFFYLKEKRYFPLLEMEKIEQINPDEIKLHLNRKECEYILTAFYALKEIGFEHNIKVNFSLLNNLMNQIENNLQGDNDLMARAVEKAGRYKEELKRSVRSYVVKSLRANLVLPENLVLNKMADQYDGENPATIRKEIIKMIEFALKHKLKLLISFYSLYNKKIEKMVELKYLYDNRILYFYDRSERKEDTVAVDRIIFSMLL
ncbi:MAG: helicase-associated domain-containing protein [bacterium]|nr:helicase-associated domain-containing protein [bacterium]